MNAPLLKIKEVATHLGVSKALVYDMVHKGELPCVRFRTEMRIRQEDLDAYVAVNTAISSEVSLIFPGKSLFTLNPRGAK